jgi:hypothetical protein
MPRYRHEQDANLRKKNVGEDVQKLAVRVKRRKER